MQVTETASDGLKREFQVIVPASDLDARVIERLDDLKDEVRINGFRPGKVPVAHLKRVYGRAVMAETIEAIDPRDERQDRQRSRPQARDGAKVTLPNEETEVEKVIGGQADLAYTVALEVLPKIELADFKGIKLERLSPRSPTPRSTRRSASIAEQNRPFCGQGRGREGRERRPRRRSTSPARSTAQPFEGGTGEDVAVHARLRHLHPGLRGPADRHRGRRDAAGEGDLPGRLSGKPSSPARTPSSRSPRSRSRRPARSRSTTTSPSRSASNRSTSSRTRSRTASQQEHAAHEPAEAQARSCSTRSTRMHKFDLPPTLVEQEFENVWKRGRRATCKAQGRTFEDEGTTEEKAQRGIPQDRRAARAARPGAGGNRRARTRSR